MSEASVSTILKALMVGIPRQGRALTWDLICLTREVWISTKEDDYFVINQIEVYIIFSSPYRSPQCSLETQGIFVAVFYQ